MIMRCSTRPLRNWTSYPPSSLGNKGPFTNGVGARCIHQRDAYSVESDGGLCSAEPGEQNEKARAITGFLTALTCFVFRFLRRPLVHRSGASEKFKQVAVGIFEIDAASATPVIGLHILL